MSRLYKIRVNYILTLDAEVFCVEVVELCHINNRPIRALTSGGRISGNFYKMTKISSILQNIQKELSLCHIL